MGNYDGSDIPKLVIGVLDDEMYKAFCGDCSKYKRDKADDREICPVDFKMDDPECEHHDKYTLVTEQAAAIQNTITGE